MNFSSTRVIMRWKYQCLFNVACKFYYLPFKRINFEMIKKNVMYEGGAEFFMQFWKLLCDLRLPRYRLYTIYLFCYRVHSLVI